MRAELNPENVAEAVIRKLDEALATKRRGDVDDRFTSAEVRKIARGVARQVAANLLQWGPAEVKARGFELPAFQSAETSSIDAVASPLGGRGKISFVRREVR